MTKLSTYSYRALCYVSLHGNGHGVAHRWLLDLEQRGFITMERLKKFGSKRIKRSSVRITRDGLSAINSEP